MIVELADTLRRKYGQLPAFIKKTDKVIITFRVLEVFPTEDKVTADRNIEVGKQKDREIRQVEDYLTANKIKADKTETGTYFTVQTPGDGPQVDTGKQVSVRYTGKLMPSGKMFETNMSGANTEPYKFVVGQHRVIEGWDDGLKKFKKGGKGYFICSRLPRL